MPDLLNRKAKLIAALELSIAERGELISELAPYGLHDKTTWGQVDARFRDLEDLWVEAGQHENTASQGDFIVPGQELAPRLGTTIGDLGLSPGGGEVLDDAGNLKQELLDNLLHGLGVGSGTKIGTGTAAGKPDSFEKELDREIKRLNDQLKQINRQNEKLRALIELHQKLDDATGQTRELKDKLEDVKKKQPVPDDPGGTYVPAHPLPNPDWNKVKPPPREGPGVDDSPIEPGGSSTVLKERGQSTDPKRGDDQFEASQRRSSVWVFQGVVDPIRRVLARLAKVFG